MLIRPLNVWSWRASPLSSRSLLRRRHPSPEASPLLRFGVASPSWTRRTGPMKTLGLSTSSSSSSWRVGDTVWIQPTNHQNTTNDDSALRRGVIEDIRGGGWYNVRVVETDSIQKVRANRFLSESPIQEEREQLTTSPPRTFVPTFSSAVKSFASVASPQELPSTPGSNPIAITANYSIASTYVPPLPINSTEEENEVEPPPTMIDLDALLSEGATTIGNAVDPELALQIHHLTATVQHWVVFSDLHVAPATLDTCLQVLDHVHQVAATRNITTGVLFLGDFWHHRGTLRVDCLNAILEELSKWKVPLILLPGNHDQVTLGGHVHGLTPLAKAFRLPIPTPSYNNNTKNDGSTSTMTSIPGPLVITHPTKLANALLIPHVRNATVMKSVLQSSLAREAHALLVHADVTGAFMNDLVVSQGGVHPTAFPADKPIYSGHFHKPHVVTSNKRIGAEGRGNDECNMIRIEYVGSPYETTLAEASQEKALLVLDATQAWKCIERIPLQLGTKHYKLSSLAEVLHLGLATGDTTSTSTTAAVNGASDRGMVRKGDRVIITTAPPSIVNGNSEEQLTQDRVEDRILQLRKMGVTVEIRDHKDDNEVSQAMASKDAQELEELTPESTWKRFWTEEIQRGVVTHERVDALQTAGLAILEELEVAGSGDPRVGSHGARDLRLDSVTVEGYGSFRDAVTYPLHDRGLVLLRGTNMDVGSDSNGSGKTTLAMAALWALTGSADPRPFQDNRVGDVVNDAKKSARVTLQGYLNGQPFLITRTKSAKKNGLTFILDNDDLTTQSPKDTMMVIEEKLGVSSPVIARTMFHGQHSLNDLLEATDAKFKDELSMIVPLQLWQDAGTITRSKSREASKSSTELQGMVALRTGDLESLRRKRDEADEDLRLKVDVMRRKEREVELHKNVVFQEDGTQFANPTKHFDSLGGSLAEVVYKEEVVQQDLTNLEQKATAEIQDLTTDLNVITEAAACSERRYQQLHLERQSAERELGSLQNKLQDLGQKWSTDLSAGMPLDFVAPETCPTCHQPVSSTVDGHSYVDLKSVAEDEIRKVLEDMTGLQKNLDLAETKVFAADRARADTEAERTRVQDELQVLRAKWAEQISDKKARLVEVQLEKKELSRAFTAAANNLQQVAMSESLLESSLTSERDAVVYARRHLEILSNDVHSMELALKDLKDQMNDQKALADKMASLSDAFGNRGVQTFVLQNAVNALQATTQMYLDEFSDGAQRLQLTLDAGDRISRRALVRAQDGDFRERPLATLSGGQWRRCSLALNLGFADLIARRGKLRPSLCVLDEPLTHLDRSGRKDVGRVLRKLVTANACSAATADLTGATGQMQRRDLSRFALSTIIVILQDLAAEEMEEAFDHMDEVVRKGGASSVKVDENS